MMARRVQVTSICLYIWISLVLLWNNPVDGNCSQIVRYITHSMGIESRIKPNIQGEWTSSQCEVRPGPKFVIRYIQVFRNSSWVGRFHHYSDVHCSKPTFTLLIKGHMKMGKESPHLKGSTTTNFNFTIVELHPHTAQVEKDLMRSANRACSNAVRNVSIDQGVGVYRVQPRALNRRACRKRFGLAKFELSLIKLDKLKDKSSKEDLLYFAEIPSPYGRKWSKRRKYAPRSYQLPLKRHNAPNCTVCAKVRRSTPSRPHIFQKERPHSVILDEEWGSFTCETRPGSFLTRYMSFNSKSRSFEGRFYYYGDPYCKKIEFMVYAKGHFTGGVRSDKVKDGENFVFTVTEASITPFTNMRTRQLNSFTRKNECGKRGEWQTGVAQDITKSKGCQLYGINLPHSEYDLLKLEYNEHHVRELYLGQRYSDDSSPDSPMSRPTSYQIPMVECSRFKSLNFVPPTPEPTQKPSTRYPIPKAINPILTVPTLKRDDDKTTPKQNSKTVKGTKGTKGTQGTKGSSGKGSTVRVQGISGTQTNSSTMSIVVLLAVIAGLL